MSEIAPRILVVDDDDVVREALREELSASFAVSVATSGEEGLDLIRTRSFDAVVSDVRMPGLGGVAFLRSVADNDASIVRVFLTGYDDDEVYETARDTGAIKLTKPWGHELELILLQAVGARRSAQELGRERGRVSAVGVMAASVAHDIRTPLAVLAANRHFLRETLADRLHEPDLAEVIEDDGVAIEAIQRVLDALRDFASEPTAGEPIPVFSVVDRSARLLRKRLQQQHTELRVLCGGGAAVHALTTWVELSQIVTNLLGNALDASPAGSVVALEVTKADDQVLIRVSDDGSGVDPKDQGALFRPFHTRKSNGMGLGLCISREMARRHSGEVRFVGNGVGVARGACFEVRLPSAPPGPLVIASCE